MSSDEHTKAYVPDEMYHIGWEVAKYPRDHPYQSRHLQQMLMPREGLRVNQTKNIHNIGNY